MKTLDLDPLYDFLWRFRFNVCKHKNEINGRIWILDGLEDSVKNRVRP